MVVDDDAGRSGVLALLARAGQATLDLLLPPHCLTCDAPILVSGGFCPDCFRQLGLIGAPCCQRCGVPFTDAGQGGAESLCPACRDHPPPWDRARAALRYDALARRVLLPFKHGDRTETAAALAPLMARAGGALLREAEVIVPVPLHRWRLLVRRYNQAALLARALSRLSGVPACLDALRRRHATPSLGDLGAAERAAVVEGVFTVRQRRLSRIAGRRVLLVDDVLTSGATCGACTRVLLASGAAGVDVLVAARVPDPRLR
ncbi:Competence protein F [Rhodovastum atsumiense]|uniref:ComF family protein n=1 Tax=Rhodovastum atsumiense TaxID=504468 RepID=A0A5M6ISS0_9PROT|nr:ComF family protein [Rhodovastum atsumiense]KAA5611370.1 ComF family protein [Rhodovastum atsumiense]CAH2603630.1 Competence protein F [Rhodovastum atsumiense]